MRAYGVPVWFCLMEIQDRGTLLPYRAPLAGSCRRRRLRGGSGGRRDFYDHPNGFRRFGAHPSDPAAPGHLPSRGGSGFCPSISLKVNAHGAQIHDTTGPNAGSTATPPGQVPDSIPFHMLFYRLQGPLSSTIVQNGGQVWRNLWYSRQRGKTKNRRGAVLTFGTFDIDSAYQEIATGLRPSQ